MPEGGVRPLYLAGVPTCALPLCCAGRSTPFHVSYPSSPGRGMVWNVQRNAPVLTSYARTSPGGVGRRAEERRVGKEGRAEGGGGGCGGNGRGGGAGDERRDRRDR